MIILLPACLKILGGYRSECCICAVEIIILKGQVLQHLLFCLVFRSANDPRVRFSHNGLKRNGTIGDIFCYQDLLKGVIAIAL